jgi:putative glutamine amidotransferase
MSLERSPKRLPPARPVVGIIADTRQLGPHSFDVVGRKYTHAVAQIAQCTPFLIPAGDGLCTVQDVLAQVDGLFFPGSPSNIHPMRYGSQEAPYAADKLDEARDALSLSLLRAALENKTPLFAVCRGLQELNTALGGTLNQSLHTRTHGLDHREDATKSLEVQYGPAHLVALTGWFAHTIGETSIMVNSLHGQGIAMLAPNLVAQGIAPDGVIEAVCTREMLAGDGFAIGCQWHPEWQAAHNPASVALFQAFGTACREARKCKH